MANIISNSDEHVSVARSIDNVEKVTNIIGKGYAFLSFQVTFRQLTSMVQKDY